MLHVFRVVPALVALSRHDRDARPIVVVMRFDLGALVKVVDFDPEQAIGTPRLNQAVELGTHVPATGTLLWVSPAANKVPTR